ncbi:MAG: hypothetical protein EOM12_17565 [Verrucomicrobiae bacterium]|nr:hypothetical protein [Verrucomicrobiae bacterium]
MKAQKPEKQYRHKQRQTFSLTQDTARMLRQFASLKKMTMTQVAEQALVQYIQTRYMIDEVFQKAVTLGTGRER